MANETHIREVTKKVRLIDADALKALFDERYDHAFMQMHTRPNIAHWEGYSIGVNWGRNTIVDAPAVDAVEVVRCKDCKYYREGAIFKDIKFCFRLRGDNDKPVGYNFSEDDFCSRGERREGE